MPTKNILKINKQDGSLTIKNHPIIIKKGINRMEVAKHLTPLYRSNIKYQDDSEWLFFEDIEFADAPCKLGLFFEEDQLVRVSFEVTPVHLDRSKSGWTSDESIDEAVTMTLIEFRFQLSRPFNEGKESFDWGKMWAVADYQSSEMNAGITYR